MNNEKVYYGAGMFGLIFGAASSLLSGVLLFAVAIGVLTLSSISVTALSITFFISLVGVISSYFWFIKIV